MKFTVKKRLCALLSMLLGVCMLAGVMPSALAETSESQGLMVGVGKE